MALNFDRRKEWTSFANGASLSPCREKGRMAPSGILPRWRWCHCGASARLASRLLVSKYPPALTRVPRDATAIVLIFFSCDVTAAGPPMTQRRFRYAEIMRATRWTLRPLVSISRNERRGAALAGGAGNRVGLADLTYMALAAPAWDQAWSRRAGG